MALTRRALALAGAGGLLGLTTALLLATLRPAEDVAATAPSQAPSEEIGTVTAPLRTAPAPVPPQTSTSSDPTARRLRGRLEDTRTGDPIAGARVAARSRGGGPVTFAETDADGAFELVDVAPGELELVPLAEGWPTSTPRVVAADEQYLLLRLERLLLRGLVSGAVPRPDLRVEALSGVDGQAVNVPVHAARFELSLPHPGRWSVRAAQRGAASPWRQVDVRADTSLELTLAAEVAVTGTVRDADGEPRVARVELRDSTGRALQTATDMAGAFRVPAVPGERYTLVARLPGLAPAVREVEAPASLDLWLEPLVTIPTTPFVGHDGQPVAGTLTLDPGVRDPHLHPDPQLPFEVGFDADGRPQLDGLPPGHWQLAFLEPAAEELRAWTLDVDTDDPQPLTFDGQGPRSPVEGRVLANFPEDELIQVELRPAEPTADDPTPDGFQFVVARAADADGRFAFDGVPPGRYVLHADWGSGTTSSEPFVVEEGRAGWVEVSE